MDNPEHRVVADEWSWRTLAPWIVPPLVVPILLIFLVAGYVLYQGAN